MSELEQLRRECQQLRQRLDAVSRIVFARGWKPAQRVTALASQLTLWQSETVEAPVSRLAAETGLSAETVSNGLHSLNRAGLVEWHSERVPLATDGSEVLPGQPAARFETSSVLFARPLPDALPETLPEAARSRQKREKQAAARAALTALSALPCPHCGVVGELHAACGACGEVVAADDYPDPADADAPDLGSSQIDPTDSTKGGGEAPDAGPLPPDLGSSQMDTDRSGFFRADLGSSQIEHSPAGESGFDIRAWLLKRIGADQRLILQQNSVGPNKYRALPGSHHVNLDAYLKGWHGFVYGSRARRSDGTTWLLSFDFDDVGHAPGLRAAQALAQAGAAPVYWQRGDGGHLELYFDQPVSAEAARAWCEQHAPALRFSDECYPCAGSGPRRGSENATSAGVGEAWKDCINQGESWPLVRLVSVHSAPYVRAVSCPMYAISGTGQVWQSEGWLEGEEQQGIILQALAACVTPAALIPAPQAESAPASLPLSARRSPSTPRPALDDSSTVKAAIRWFNESHTPAALGLPDSGHFRVRANDKTPSCCWDKRGLERGEWIATDYGNGHAKHDLFDVWVLVNGRDKSEEIARLCEEYRYHLDERRGEQDAATSDAWAALSGEQGERGNNAIFL